MHKNAAISLFSTAVLAAISGSLAAQCDPPDSCPPDDPPTITDTFPVTPPTTTDSKGGRRFWWDIVGSKKPQSPISHWASFIPMKWRWHPYHNAASMSGTLPSEFHTRMVHGVFEQDMWELDEQLSQFAPRVIMMYGSLNSSLFHTPSGVDETRPGDDLAVNARTAQKNIVGQMNRAIILRGGSAWDAFSAIGQANYAYPALDNSPIEEPNHEEWPEPDPPEDPGYPIGPISWDRSFQQHHAAILQAGEHTAYISRPFSNDGTGGLIDTWADARNQTIKEDDPWAPFPAAIRDFVGMDAMVRLDGKRTEQLLYKHWPANGGGCEIATYIDEAIGVQANVIGKVEKSYINVGKAYGWAAVFTMGNVLVRDSAMSLCACDENGPDPLNERCCSRVNLYTGISVEAPFDHSAGCTIEPDVINGPFVAEMTMNSGGGSPAQVASLLPTNDDGIAVAESVAIERHASLIARGHSVFGDGTVSDPAATGYDTDVMHINGALRLAPRTSPPVLSPDLPPHARAGIVYFDAARACLRVSVPILLPTDDPADWRNARVAWVDVARDLSAINPATDTVGSAALAAAPAQDVRDAITATASDTAAGDPAFAAPALVVKEVLPIAGHGAEIVFEVRGLAADAPVLYWRLTKNPARGTGATQWTLVEAEAVTALPGANPAVREYAALLAGDIPVPPRERTDDLRSVQLMAFNPATGQTSGAAFTARF